MSPSAMRCAAISHYRARYCTGNHGCRILGKRGGWGHDEMSAGVREHTSRSVPGEMRCAWEVNMRCNHDPRFTAPPSSRTVPSTARSHERRLLAMEYQRVTRGPRHRGSGHCGGVLLTLCRHGSNAITTCRPQSAANEMRSVARVVPLLQLHWSVVVMACGWGCEWPAISDIATPINDNVLLPMLIWA
jgi:hypothetical protein